MSKLLFRLTLLFALAGTIVFVGCQKDTTSSVQDDAATATEIELRDGVEAPHGGPEGCLGLRSCFQLVFPVTVEFPDGTTAEAADLGALKTLLDEWRAANPDEHVRPRIAFPHDIELPNGAVVTVQNARQLREFVRRCAGFDPGPGHLPGPCFQLIFPVTVNFPDGTSAPAADRRALAEAVKAWHDANPDAEGRPEIAFPYQVRLHDGTLATVNNEGELQALVGNCRNERPGPDFERCFRLVYPVTLTFPDGGMETFDNYQEMMDGIRAWRMDNPDAEGRPEITFPQAITLSDGSTVTVNSKEELEDIIGNCWEDRPFDTPCFRLEYPLTVKFADGSTLTLQSPAAMHLALKAWHRIHGRHRQRPELVYPINIKYADGTTQAIANKEELKAAYQACGDDE